METRNLRAAGATATLLFGASSLLLLASPEAGSETPTHTKTARAARRAPGVPSPGSPARAVSPSTARVLAPPLPATASRGAPVHAAARAHAETPREKPATRATLQKKAAARGPLTAAELAEVRDRLALSDAKARAAALREVRDRGNGQLDPEVRALLASKTSDFSTRRLAAQVLALGDANGNRAALEPFKNDPDAVVRINVAFGLARAGDDAAQAWLLRLLTASRALSPTLAPFVENALESPDLTSVAVLDHYRAIAANPSLDPAARDRAARILASKLGPR